MRKLWREDAGDDDRAIGQVFAQVGVFQNLIPLFLKTAGGSEREQKIALACTDLLTSITWPLDADAEIRAAASRGQPTEHHGNLLRLQNGMIAYKSAALRQRCGETSGSVKDREVLGTMMKYILLPPLSKPRHHRNERDIATISMVLHFFRNLLVIRDPVATTLSSSDQIANSILQSDVVRSMSKFHILEALLMLANGAETPDYAPWNVITAECVFAIFGGLSAASFASNDKSSTGPPSAKSGHNSQTTPPKNNSILSSFLDAEAHERRMALAGSGSSRHSRFGTAVNFLTADGQRRVARNTGALRKSIDELRNDAEMRCRRRIRRRKKAIEEGAPRVRSDWTPAARAVLREWADRFMLSSGFEKLTRSVLTDIANERAKVGDLAEARVKIMLLSAFFLDYFLARKTSGDERRIGEMSKREPLKPVADASHVNSDNGDAATAQQNETSEQKQAEESDSTRQDNVPSPATWLYSLLSEWLKPWAFKMVYIRARDTLDQKLWLELEASLQLWMSLLRLVDCMSRKGSEVERDVAESLQANHFYNQDTLDVCVKVARCYGSQSLAFLDTVIAFINCMPRMLEKYSTNKEHIYVRAKRHARKDKSKAAAGSGDEIEGIEEEDAARQRADQLYTERKFSFERFQGKLCVRPLVEASVSFLGRWRDFVRPNEQLSNVVGVMHRVAVKASSVQSFYPAHIRLAFAALTKSPLLAAMQPVAPQAAQDCKKLMSYCLKRYDRLSPEEKELWATGKAAPRPPKAVKLPREIEVKAGFSRDDQVGVAVGLLAESNKMPSVMWVKDALEHASAERTQVVFNVDGKKIWQTIREQEGREDGDGTQEPTAEERDAINDAIADAVPSEEAVAMFQAHELSYAGKLELQEEATKSPPLKLLCRLMGLESDEDDETHWKWRVPSHLLPTHLNADAQLIENFIRTPLWIDAASFEMLTQNVRKPRVPKTRHLIPEDAHLFQEGDESDSSTSGSDSDGSVVMGETSSHDKQKTGRRKRADLKGDKRKKKGFRKAPTKPAPLFMADDLIDSDEEDQVERLWAQQNGVEVAAPSSRPKARAVRAVSTMSSTSSDDDDDERAASPPRRRASSSTPPTSPPTASANEEQRTNRRKERRSTQPRARNALFFESDSDAMDDESDADGGGVSQQEHIITTPVSPATTLRPTQKRAAALADSDSEAEAHGRDHDAGSDNGSSPRSASRGSPVRRTASATQTKRRKTRPSLASALAALADSDDE